MWQYELARLTDAVKSASQGDRLSKFARLFCADVFTPAIATLANLSLQTGIFPTRYK